ncbi:hypothetical protein BHE74_00013442 [Ensete ventricosum]|nr:hypothetical protein BHE74_00013442 [Ensete ventricosum]
MAGRGATLVLRTSWFNRSSWIRAKEIAAISKSFLESLPRESSMGVFKPIEPLNNISLEVYGSNLHPCSMKGISFIVKIPELCAGESARDPRATTARGRWRPAGGDDTQATTAHGRGPYAGDSYKGPEACPYHKSSEKSCITKVITQLPQCLIAFMSLCNQEKRFGKLSKYGFSSLKILFT